MRNGWYLAAVLAIVSSAALAEQTKPRNFPSDFGAPLLDYGSVALPYATPSHSAGTAVDHNKFRKKETPQASLDTIELGGKSMLRLDMTETNTRAAADVPDYTNVIVPLAPGKKRETPRYLGFKLSTPTH